MHNLTLLEQVRAMVALAEAFSEIAMQVGVTAACFALVIYLVRKS